MMPVARISELAEQVCNIPFLELLLITPAAVAQDRGKPWVVLVVLVVVARAEARTTQPVAQIAQP
jgi:hypothetical protein